MVLFPKGRPPVRYNIEPLLTRGDEWADADRYVPDPELLWIGLDNRARDFARVDFKDIEKRAKPF